MQRSVGLHHLAQCAVHPKAHAAVAFIRLNVDVAGPVPCGLGEQGVEHADDGRIITGFQQVFDRGQLLHHARQVGFGLDFADHGGCGGRAVGLPARIGLVDALQQVVKAAVLHLKIDHAEFAGHLGQCRAVTLMAPGQGVGVTVVFQQQSAGFGKGVRQWVAHGLTAQGWREGGSEGADGALFSRGITADPLTGKGPVAVG